jgi:hypothetical protein
MGLSGEEALPVDYREEGATMPRDRRKTWQYFAQAVIQEEDPESLTSPDAATLPRP